MPGEFRVDVWDGRKELHLWVETKEQAEKRLRKERKAGRVAHWWRDDGPVEVLEAEMEALSER